jgi:hypothetical protein
MLDAMVPEFRAKNLVLDVYIFFQCYHDLKSVERMQAWKTEAGCDSNMSQRPLGL